MSRSLITARRRPYLKAWGWTLSITAVLILLAALFATRFFFVRSGTMRRALLKGDFVYVDKCGYGARIPEHPLAIPYSDRFYSSIPELPYMRMPGITGIQKNDVLVFNDPRVSEKTPIAKRPLMMKRCVGLPGDSISIQGEEVLVNGDPIDQPPSVITSYHVKVEADSSLRESFDRFWVKKPQALSNRGDYVVFLRKKDARRLRKEEWVHFVKPWKKAGKGSERFFPKDPSYAWGPGHVPPLYIPARGGSVHLDTNTLPLYRRVIEVYEGHEVSVSDTIVRIDGKPRNSYSFEKDYFYVLGDPRPFSEDSRTWGFLPEDHIIGRALFVLFSYNMEKGAFRGDRTFRWIP